VNDRIRTGRQPRENLLSFHNAPPQEPVAVSTKLPRQIPKVEERSPFGKRNLEIQAINAGAFPWDDASIQQVVR